MIRKELNETEKHISDGLAQGININSYSLEMCIHQNQQFRMLLKEAAELFRFYENSHRQRGPEHTEKAERNADIAKRIELAIGGNFFSTIDLINKCEVLSNT